MRTVATTAFLALTLGIAGCAQQPVAPVVQTATPANPAGNTSGSMAYPAPRASGEFQRPAVTGFDTGSMSLPTTARPGLTTTPTTGPADTGNMAYPAPRASGTLPSKVVR